MKLLKQVFSVAAFSTVAAMGCASSAQAISFTMTKGIAGSGDVTNQGAFSDYYHLPNTTTITFNSGQAPTTGFAQYSFERNRNNASSVRSDKWAPAGPQGEVNISNYLAVFQGDKVTIKLAKTLNYFGINWGAISGGNIFSFYMNDKLIKSFSTANVNPVAPVKAAQHGGEGNGFVHFYSTSKADNFNRIVIEQKGGGGFESDNHSFHAGTGKFDPKPVPEPSILLGLATVASTLLLRRNAKRGLA